MSLIIGRKPVLDALNSKEKIEKVYLLYGQHGGIIDSIRIAAKKKGIKCTELPKEKFFSLSKNNSQGVIAVKETRIYTPLNELIKYSKNSKYPLILILDSIQDTHNFGAIIRTAECAGVNGIIFTTHNSAPLNETVVKTSAGATEFIKLCPVNNLSQAINELKESGFWIVGTSLKESKNYSEIDYKIPLALILGNEEKGMRRLTEETCDFLIKIPMKGKIDSLNVSVSTGVVLFEILRQRGNN